ncbi:MAG: right-handed parallel beta-helix repeat-containing protein, partial [Phycisphaerae bacterium]
VAEPSVYSEAIDFQGKAITLTSTDPGNPQVVASTILDATVFQSSAVRCASGEGSGTVIDGLTISGGAAVNGGGLFVGPAATPVVKRSTFVGNLAQFGGGIYESPGSAPTVVDCTFNNNTATSRGGGIYMNQAGPSLAGCEFQVNSAQFGGGVYVLGTSPAITDCRFLRNNALTRGGGLFVQDASPTVAHCLFEGNSAISQGGGLSGFPGGSGHVTITESRFAFNGAGGDGGAVWCDTTRFTIQQCDFEKNQAARGAALFLSGPAPQPFDVRGCRFFGNVASNLSGGPGKSAVLFVKSTNDQTAQATVHQCLFSGNIGSGITAEGDSALVEVTSCTLAHGRLASVAANASALVQLRNCILWGDTLPEIVTELEGKVLWTYCNIQGLGGAGGQAPNYDFDPRFADAAGPDGLPGTADDDLHLTAGSPCINAGQGVHNPNNPQFDFDGTPRSQGGSTDLGAYEFPIDCDASGTPDYVEIQEGALADCNGNLQYDECESVLDCNRNGIMDECDIKSGLLHDSNGNGFADECEVSGILSGTNQWSLSNRAIVFVTQDLTVTGSLTIHPGVLVRFANNVKMTVFNAGHLMVAGSADEPVVFTSWKARPAAGDWGGLRFAAGSSGSLANAVIGYSRNHGVRIEGPSVPVQYCTIHDVSGVDQPAGTASNPAQPGGPAYGIYLTGNASSTILGNTIERLSGGTGGRGAAGRSGDTGNFGSNGFSAGQSGGNGLNAASAGLPGAAGAVGGEAAGIYCGPQSNPTLRNNVVRRVRGGDGGDGGYGGWGGGGGEGGSGMMGDPTPDSIQF